ncbi:MAG: hypothetical protein CVV60_05145 [Tenericutes bacterium HGW-Tenericutes-5]|nr:MAG: hypothetical protein CVV60_05145 [Tenericutes bacterium HGW-Tenericutes-5]
MGFTSSQIEAIHSRGSNVLVSASAGSGKTGVLKERVIEMLKAGEFIDELVVLTFTEAAAAEMKSRIVNDIYELKLTKQIERIDNAIISTFDAFTLRLVKEYHYLLGLDSNIGINDQVIISSRKKQLIKDVLKKYYLAKNPDFLRFFKMYFSKSDHWLEESVYSIGEAFRKRPDYFSLIENYDSFYLNEIFLESKADDYIESIKDQIRRNYLLFDKYFNNEANLVDLEYQNYLNEVNRIIVDLLEKSGDDFLSELVSISFPSKPRNKDTDKPKIIEQINKLKKDFDTLFASNKKELISNFRMSSFSVKILLEIVSEYLKRFESIKKEEKLFSFEDIMFYAIELFEKFEDVRFKFKNQIKEILIDEYQDTNDLQDRFISLIANENVFMVGDVKQSIYRFRNANPKNFMRIYDEYLNKGSGKAIFLQENFRSNKYVLESINKIFKQIMTTEVGGVDYEGKQVLISGYNNDSLLHQKNAFITKLYDFEKVKEVYQDLEKANVEAKIVAKDIVARLSRNELIYDLKKQAFRSLEYKDITILVSQKTDFNIYLEELSKYNIPVELYDDKPFFAGDEIRFIFEMIRLIYCFKDEEYLKQNFKSSLFGVARSFVYEIKDEEIITFLVKENVLSISDLNVLNNYESLKAIYEDIQDIIANFWDFPNGDIIEAIYKRLRIYSRLASLENPFESEKKIDFFLMKVKSLKEFEFKDLILYLEDIIEDSSYDIEYKEKKTDINAIKLMSMHKSKGLQFPLVYLIGLYKQFHNPENKSPFIFSKDLGILTKSYLDGFYPNFMQKLLFNEVDKEDLSEKLRLLYVAMTRAVNELVMVLDYKEDIDEFKTIKSFSILLHQTLKFDESDLFDFKVDDFELEEKKLEETNKVIKLNRFSFAKEEVKRVSYSKKINDLLDDETIRLLESGSEYHKYLEMVDFNNVGESIVTYPNFVRLAIEELVGSSLFKGLKNPKYYKEYEFYEETNEGVFRGVIDLLIIDDLKIIALDYKLKNIEDSAYKRQLLGYYNYLRTKTDKPVQLFLYSLTNRVLKEIVL